MFNRKGIHESRKAHSVLAAGMVSLVTMATTLIAATPADAAAACSVSATVGNPYKHRTTSGSIQIRAEWTVSASCLGEAYIGWWVDGKQYKAGDGYYRLGRATYSYVVGGCKTGDYQQHLYVLYHPNNSGDGTEIRRTSSKVRISC